MQQYLTLEEAAKLLNLSNDELREMAKKKQIRAFQDRGTWRFRRQDIDEKARELGVSSDAELTLGEGSKSKPGAREDDDDDLISVDLSLSLDDSDDDEVPLGKEKTPPSSRGGKPSSGRNKSGSDSEVRLVMPDELEFPGERESSSRGGSSGPKSSIGKGKSKLGPGSGGGKGDPTSPKSSSRKTKSAPDSGVRLVPADEASDSDVKVVPSSKDSGVSKGSKSPSDSDIRLHEAGPGSSSKKKGDGALITEEIDLDAEEARHTEEARRPRKVSKGGAGPVLPTESPFELSEPDLGLDPESKSGKSGKGKSKPPGRAEKDSSSDFELVSFDASKSPGDIGSGEISLLPDDDEIDFGAEVAGPHSGRSGINLQKPADSGISLEDEGSDEAIEFELSLDSGMTPKPAKQEEPEDESSSEFELSLDDSGAADSSSEFELSLEDSGEGIEPAAGEGSDSEFELTLDDEGALGVDEDAGDIFEETNFDVPALDDDSGSEAVAMDSDGDTDLEGSDFEISMDDDSSMSDDDESASHVVALEDEEEAEDDAATVARPRKAAAKAKPKSRAAPVIEEEAAEDSSEFDIDLDEEPAAKKKPAKKKPAVVVDDDSEAEVEEEETGEEEEKVAAAPTTFEWGALPATLLFPTVVVMFVVGVMGFELIRGMWGYHRPSVVGKPVIDNIARHLVDDSLPKN